MSKKEQVHFVRSDEFTGVEEELNAALASLDDVNTRIEDLLAGKLEVPTFNANAAELDENGHIIEKTPNPDSASALEEGDDDDSDDSDSEDDEEDEDEYDDEDDEDEEDDEVEDEEE